MSRHVDSLCKQLDGTAFYASNYGSTLKKSASDLFKMIKPSHIQKPGDQSDSGDDATAELFESAELDLEFLNVYSKIGENLERSILAITKKLKNWLADANRIIDVESFLQMENRYIHYKRKLTR